MYLYFRSSSWIDTFAIIKCPSLSLVTIVILKSILSDSTASASLFRLLSVIVYNSVLSFYFQPTVSLTLKCVSCRNYNHVIFHLIYSLISIF